MEKIDNPPPVLTKHDFVRRYQRGEFGNRSPTWNGLADFVRDRDADPSGLYHIRNRVAGGPTLYDVPREELAARWGELLRQGVPPHTLYISQMCPTERTILQGELEEDVLTWTTVAKPMREALAQDTNTATGLQALGMLKKYLCPNSLEWMGVLQKRYPRHVIEFTTFDTSWGTLPGFNTVWWEVRRY